MAYFEQDGTGNWFHYYISDDEPIKANAGHFECGFNYSVNADGTVNIHNRDLSNSSDHMKDWSLQNVDGKLIGEEDKNMFDMELANSEQKEYAKQLFRAINGGFQATGAEPSTAVSRPQALMPTTSRLPTIAKPLTPLPIRPGAITRASSSMTAATKASRWKVRPGRDSALSHCQTAPK